MYYIIEDCLSLLENPIYPLSKFVSSDHITHTLVSLNTAGMVLRRHQTACPHAKTGFSISSSILYMCIDLCLNLFYWYSKIMMTSSAVSIFLIMTDDFTLFGFEYYNFKPDNFCSFTSFTCCITILWRKKSSISKHCLA